MVGQQQRVIFRNVREHPFEERGCARLYWTTKEDNATARSLNDRIARFNGFIRYDYALD